MNAFALAPLDPDDEPTARYSMACAEHTNPGRPRAGKPPLRGVPDPLYRLRDYAVGIGADFTIARNGAGIVAYGGDIVSCGPQQDINTAARKLWWLATDRWGA